MPVYSAVLVLRRATVEMSARSAIDAPAAAAIAQGSPRLGSPDAAAARRMTPRPRASPACEINDDQLGLVASGELNPAKSRVLLQLALTGTKDPVRIQKMFYEY